MNERRTIAGQSSTHPKRRWSARCRASRGAAAPLLLALALGACAGERQDVILVSLDTVRRDTFLAEAATIEPLWGWLAGGRAFENAYTPMPFTLAAHMTVMTGLEPRTHGLVGRGRSLSPSARTLAEILGRRGFWTAGVVSSEWLAPEFGFGRGFDRYQLVDSGLRGSPAVSTAALAAIDAAPAERRLFLFVHFYDAHSDGSEGGNRSPYFVPAADLPAEERRGSETEFCDRLNRCATELLVAANREQLDVPRTAIDRIEERYRLGVRRQLVDLARFLGELDRRQRARSALVILFSDHGEEFREHGRFLHSQVYDESAHVPLVLRDGALPAHTVDSRLVGLGDLFATIVAFAGGAGEMPNGQRGGVDLLAPVDRRSSAAVVSIQDKLFLRRSALRSESWKLVVDAKSGERRLYDLAADPGERLDRVADRPEVAAELQALLEGRIAQELRLGARYLALEGADSLSQEQIDKLRSLGYLD